MNSVVLLSSASANDGLDGGPESREALHRLAVSRGEEDPTWVGWVDEEHVSVEGVSELDGVGEVLPVEEVRVCVPEEEAPRVVAATPEPL